MTTKTPWFTDEELERIEREDQILEARAAVDAWRPKLELVKSNPRYTAANIAGRV